MNYETDLKDNWILDIEHSNKSSNSFQTQMVLDAINSQIDENKKVFDNIATDFRVEFGNHLFKIPSNIIKKPSSKYRSYIYNSQKWIGQVIELSEKSFTAKLEDKIDPTTYEIAQFEIEEVSEDDFDLLKLGALFYWFVGYANQEGRVFKQSLVRFKRDVELTESEFDYIIDRANELNDILNWD